MGRQAATLILVSLLCASCVGRYTAPEKSAPQATLHIITDLPHLTVSGWRYHTDSGCSDSPASLGAFSKLYDGQKKVQLRAGEKRFLLVKTSSQGVGASYSCGASTCISNTTCTVEFEITPVAGKTYQARHAGDGYSCSVRVTDQATGTVPPEVRPMTVPASCKNTLFK